MKRLNSLILFLTVLLLFQNCSRESEMDRFVGDLIKKMTVEEKIGQLNLATYTGGVVTGSTVNDASAEKIRNGQVGAFLGVSGVELLKKLQDIAVNESRLKIPLFFGMDVIHGHRTVFPIPLGLSCSWDIDLIEKSARIAATEAAADGLNWVYSPMVDLARDPRWGRVAEGAGEDLYLGSLIAAAMVRGYQGPGLKDSTAVMSCVKHYALYGAAEGGRDYNTVDMSLIRMYQDYLRPYKAAVEAGVGSVMTSFNDINGIPATANKWLLTEVLRNQWGFKGFVVTDYTAINELTNHGLGDLQHVSALALKAGVDMDMVGEGFLTTLKKSLDEGKITMAEIDQACRRILEAKYKMGLFEDPYRHINEARAKREILKPENLAFAREAAKRSIVLLKNANNVLPLKKSGTVAVIGPLADRPEDMLGTWAFFGDRSKIVTVVQGIKNVGGEGVKVVYAKGSELSDDPGLNAALSFFGSPVQSLPGEEVETNAQKLLREAVSAARASDVVVAVLGEAAGWSGEAASRSDIGLPATQKRLLEKLLETGKPIVLVLINGRPLTLAWEDENVPAVVEAWAPGTEAGNAIADVLFGDYNPSGRLTMSFPRNTGQIPVYYNHKNTGRPFDANNKFTSKYLDIPNEPLYPFGFGLSYTTFEYGDLVADKTELKGDDTLTVIISVSNTGKYAGEETVQLYIQDPVASISRPVKELKGFKKVLLQPGEKKEVSFTVTTEDLKFYNTDLSYNWEPGEFIIYAGPNSADLKQVKVNWQ
ncbi:MAG: beta-glucosidase BglX [Bacteroidales bacterium]